MQKILCGSLNCLSKEKVRISCVPLHFLNASGTQNGVSLGRGGSPCFKTPPFSMGTCCMLLMAETCKGLSSLTVKNYDHFGSKSIAVIISNMFEH